MNCVGHATPTIFPRADSEYFLANVPPMFITVFHKDAVPADKANNSNGLNGNNGHHAKVHKNRSLAANRASR